MTAPAFHDHRVVASVPRLVGLTCLIGLVGCQTLHAEPPVKIQPTALSMPWSKSKPTDAEKEAKEAEEKSAWQLPWSKAKSSNDRIKNDVAGPLQRLSMANQKAAVPQTAEDRRHVEIIKKARDLIEDGQKSKSTTAFAEAEDLLADVVKERDPKKFSWKKVFTLSDEEERPIYDPFRAEAAFYLAEAQFRQNNLRQARDYYKLVVKEYPSTPYVDRSSRRLFEIARQWLGDLDFATTEDVQQVNLEEPQRVDPVKKSAAPHRSYHVNLTDKSRPRLDTNGYAIDALRTIWTYDSTGPLADDALMLAATYYLREGDYIESDRLFSLLREQFPKSTHLESAFVLGSHVKLASYQGAAYDEEQLEEAKQLKESILRLFPNTPDADRVRRELRGIHEARAQRIWAKAEFYGQKNKSEAVVIYCQQILAEYPDTKYAELARAELAKRGKSSNESPSKLSARAIGKSISSPFRSEPADDE